MKIILLKDVAKVGRKYDVKEVAEGFALNMLIPRGLAQIATKDAIARVEKTKANDLTDKKIQEELLVKNLETINKLVIEIKEKANEKGHLFAGITKERLHSELTKSTRLNLDLDFIKLDKPLKQIGEHKIKVKAMSKSAEFTVNILSA